MAVPQSRIASCAFAAMAMALLAGSLPVTAQLVSGTVVDDGTARPVAGATIELMDTTGVHRGTAVSDTAGQFRIMAPRPGFYRLQISHVAYATMHTAAIEAALGVQVTLELRMSPTTVALEPLRVVGRSAFNTGWLQEYYDRAAMTRRSGIGRVFFRDEVERANVPTVSTFLTYMQPRGRCSPTIFLDGLELQDAHQLDGLLNPDALEGVELYNSSVFQPPQYANRGHCAIALFWTRRDLEGTRPFSWKRLFVAGGILGGIIMLFQL